MIAGRGEGRTGVPESEGTGAVWREAVRFGSLGVLNTLAGIAIIFAGLSVLRLDYRLANTAGYLVVVVAGFFLTRRWVFAVADHGRLQFVRYCAVIAVSYLVQLSLLVILKEGLGMGSFGAQLPAAAAYSLVAFVLHRTFTFRQGRKGGGGPNQRTRSQNADEQEAVSNEFDRFADTYERDHRRNIRLSGEDPDYFAEYKAVDLATVLKESGRAAHYDKPAILDFGGGIGNSIPHLLRHIPRAQIVCVDVSAKSLDVARRRFGAAADFVPFDGLSVPCTSGSMDVVFVACVFHHIDHARHSFVLKEMRRVLKEGGLLFIYEHNPLNPLTLRTVQRCPFDEHAVLIGASKMAARVAKAGFSSVQVRYRCFFPRVMAGLRFLEPAIAWLPLGAQYYVSAAKETSSAPPVRLDARPA